MRLQHAMHVAAVGWLIACGRIGYEPLSIGSRVADGVDATSIDAGESGSALTPEGGADDATDAITGDATVVDAAPGDAAPVEDVGEAMAADASDAPADGPPDVPPTVCSLNSNAPATLTIVNNANVTVTPYWINFSCAEVAYPNVAPGGNSMINSYVTHPWRARDSTTHVLLAEVPPLTGNTTFVVP